MVYAFLLFLAWLFAEVFVAIKVGEAIGAALTLILLFAGWPLGTWVLRTHGRAAWRRLLVAIGEGRPPGREVVDGALIVLGGVLLIIPGFVSDAIAACLLLPPTRALTRRLLVRNFQNRVVVQAASFGRRQYDVDSTATDVDQPKLRP
jgi:UPF0716 protein FxsA